MGTALVRREDAPQAWAAWAKYRVDRDAARARFVMWADNLPLYPWGQCPARES